MCMCKQINVTGESLYFNYLRFYHKIVAHYDCNYSSFEYI